MSDFGSLMLGVALGTIVSVVIVAIGSAVGVYLASRELGRPDHHELDGNGHWIDGASGIDRAYSPPSERNGTDG